MAIKNNIKLIKKQIKSMFPFIYYPLGYYFLKTGISIDFMNPKLIKNIRKVAISKKNGSEKFSKKKRILFFSMRQDPLHLAWAGTIANALDIRGHDCFFFSCDGLMFNSCNSGNYPYLSKWDCKKCHIYAKKFHSALKIPVKWLGDYANKDDLIYAEEILNKISPENYEGFIFEELKLGEMIQASVIHFLRLGGAISEEKETREIYKSFLMGAVVMTKVCRTLLSDINPDVVIMLNGWFMPEQIIFELAKRRNVEVITYENGLTTDSIILNHNKKTDYDESDFWHFFSGQKLNNYENERLDSYMIQRQQGNHGFINLSNSFLENDKMSICRELDIDTEVPVAVLFSNITWDSTIWSLNIGFSDMYSWIKSTINYFMKHQELQLIIRIHPCEEVHSGSKRDSVEIKIRDDFPDIPKNIKIVRAISNISSYSLMDLSDCCLVYNSTTGLEAALMGKSVLVSGAVHYRSKGFTYDIDSEELYYQYLNEILVEKKIKYTPEMLEIARRYAYYFFFRVSIPFPFVHFEDGKLYLTYENIDVLQPGKDKNLDKICVGIIENKTFV